MSYQKPFFVDMTSMTFDMLKKLLMILNNIDCKDDLKNPLKILSTHLGILSSGSLQSPSLPDISIEDKKELENLLYTLVDDPNCPQDVLVSLCNCLQEGMNLLLPPLQQRIGIAKDLLMLKTEQIKRSEKIKLKLIMESINDPKTIGILIQTYEQEVIVKDVMALLETLLKKDEEFGLQREERALLFTIHTQFVLFNLNTSTKFVMNLNIVKESVLQYFQTLFKVSGDYLEKGRISVKNKVLDTKIFEESVILKILHLTLVALISANNLEFSVEIIADLKMICKSGFALQKLIPKENMDNWMTLVHINALSSTFLSTLISNMFNGNAKDSQILDQTLHPSLQVFLGKNCDKGLFINHVDKN